MMGALDEKYWMAITAIRSEARARRIPFKEAFVRMMSDAGYLNVPLWNDEVDAELKLARKVKP